ncbi:MAG: amino acid adenylation domain-containing protein [Gordonia sp. (in: high G+C Gram-positive bacteria)]|uniref:non-ribosomal peptide synthetase n=1 Tax=Gordonia sp. (in: high G+C Gram-positive bacteria) TaxID=84139 RepID=UPI0039E63D7E
MVTTDEYCAALPRVWSAQPGTGDLIALAAVLDPDRPALTAAAGPVGFGALAAQVKVMTQALAAQGVDAEAAVGAAVAGALRSPDLSPQELAAAAQEATGQIRAAALDIIGSGDLGSLPGLFRVSAKHRADAIAVVDGAGRSLTYRELDAKSDAVAAALIAVGAGPEQRIGVALERDADLIIALLGVTKSGAAYLPLDRTHPVDRLAAIVDDARPVVTITDAETAVAWSDLDTRFTTVAECLTAGGPVDRIPARVDGRHPAYVMYTSGSTGTPKGVVVTHADVIVLLAAMGREYDYGVDDVWSMFQSYAFDVSVGEIWVSLAVGGRLVVLDYLTTRTPEKFVEVLAQQQVTIINITPSAFYQLAGAIRPPATGRLSPSVHTMILVGEALDFEQVRRWYADRQEFDGNDGPELNNMYGPTEATVYLTRRRLTPEFVAATAASDVGFALPGSQLYVLDSRLKPVPEGARGDLYLAGEQLARGYAGRFGLNATRFVANPFGGPGERMYQSGDVAMFRDGSLEFLGRADNQVKLRGYRIELGEVEAGLLAAAGVNEAAAAIKERPGFPDLLVGYVVGVNADGSELDPAEVKKAAAGKVPDYMVPDLIVSLEHLPLNVSGKLDRKQLPEPVIEAQAEYVAPADEAEAKLAEIFADVLGVDEISVIESFFDLGGNSLLAARVVARCGEALGVDLTMRDLFDAPTVRDLAVGAAHHAPGLPPLLPAEPRPERVPLSYAQQRMWFLNQFDVESAIYNIVMAARLSGDVDVDALEGAIGDAIERHEVLRTVYPAVDGTPYQHVLDVDEARDRFDWARVSSRDELAAAGDSGFDVTTDLPLRGRLSIADDGTGELALVVHHVAFDGESIGVLLADILSAYARRRDPALPAAAGLTVQYADYAIWERAELGRVDEPDTVLGTQMAYWKNKLAGLPVLTELPMDRPRPPVFDSAGDMVTVDVDDDLTAQIMDLCRAYEVTPFMVTYAALAVLVSRLGATADTVIASPAAGRLTPAVEPLAGMFVNTLVLRTATEAGRTVDDLIHGVRDDVLDAFDNVAVQFDDLVEVLSPPRSTAYSPLAQIAFTYAEPGPGEKPIDVAGMHAEPIEITGHEAKFDLMVLAHGKTEDSPLRVEFLYATALYERGTVERFSRAYLQILRELTADQSVAIGDIELGAAPAAVGPAAAPTVAEPTPAPTATGSDGEVEPGTLLDVLARRDLDPTHPALVCDGAELTYAEFEERTNTVARALLARGVAPDDTVAVGLERSIDSVVAIWGVIKTGAAYLSIDPAYPDDRIAYMLADSAVRFGITKPDTRERLGESAAQWVNLDELAAEASSGAPIAAAERNGPVRLANLAYVIYTSGSTGWPKGVAVSNAGIADLVANYQKVTGSREDDPDTRVLHVASPSFDASFFEMCWAISAGHTLVIAAHADFAGEALDTVLDRDGVTDMVITPSVLATLDPDRAGALRNLATAGEACPPDLVERWSARGRRLFNFYGPSETTVWATRARMLPGKPVTIGRAIGGFTARVLDPRLHQAPQGVTGELFLSAAGLARGYVGQPGLTATSFVADPYGAPGARMYATGDLVRITAAGDLEFAGRADHQVKINGQRVELGEIEAVFIDQPGVAQAVVIGRKSDQGGREHTQVVAYVVAESGAALDREELTAQAATRLAAHMVPSHVVVIDEVPLTPVGKTDLRALPEPVVEVGEFVPPATAAERAVAAVFADVLEVDEVSATASFFDLGGNSLLATRLAARAAEALGAAVTVRDVFDAPSVRALAEAAGDRGEALAPVVRVEPRPERIPLSFAQQRIWFINRFEEGSAAYNIPTVLRLTGPLDVDALREAMVDVTARHEVLRSVFPVADGEPYQLVSPADEVADRLDWAVVPTRDDLDAVVTEGFDLTTQWPLRLRLWSSSDTEHLLAVVVQHIAADGESLPPLITDLITAYAARVAGAAPEFEPLPVQFADYAIWQHEVLGSPEDPDSVVGRQLAYWTDTLAGSPPVLELPTDRPRPAVASQRGAQTRLSIPAATGRQVLALADRTGASPFMVVHAALAAVLARLADTDDVVVSTPTAGRGQAVLDPLVGMFVNTLLLRTKVDVGESFEALVAKVRGDDLAAFEHADVPFEAVIDAVNPVRSEAFAALSQVMLSFNPGATANADAFDVAGLRLAGTEPVSLPEQLDLTFTVATSADGDWSADVSYAVDLFDEATARAIGRRFIDFLGAATADPAGAIGDAPLLDAGEHDAALARSNGRRVDLTPTTVADLVAAQVARTPDEVALTFAGNELTYREFGARVATLARELIAADIGPETTVAVCIDRSLEMMIALHAVVAAGGQYVPIDPTTPHERVDSMVSLTDASVVLVAAGQVPAAATEIVKRLTVVTADATAAVDPAVPPIAPAERRGELLPDNAIYTMFTSGSTGLPKGVTVTHRALAAHLEYISSTRVQGSARVTLVKTPYTFDPCVVEIFWGVAVGARVAIAAPGGHRDVDYLARLIRAEGIEMVDAVPAVWSMMLDSDELAAVLADSQLHGMMTGGEALPVTMAKRAAEVLPDTRLVNQYGPTEATNFVLNHLVTDPERPLIGTPVWNTAALVLDSRLHVVPDGVVGELYLGGAQLARGYAAQARLTAERFVPDPYGEPGSVLYRTGDLVRRTATGDLDYVGRADYQVKLRGQRIELEEIEAVLAQAPGVVSAAAVVRPGPGGDALVGYVTGGEQALDLDAIRRYAADHLIAYMCPSAWVELPEMPLGSAGKIDRKALPDPDFAAAGEYVAPEGEAEEAVAAVFADVLGVDRVGATESFFDIGGNSLSAMRVVARAGEALGVELSVRELFDAPTVRELAAVAAGRGSALEAITAVSPRPEQIPLSYAQQRMWFINRLEPDLPTYNIPIALRLTGDLDVDALHAAVGDLVARHESLRTTFPAVDGEPVQVVHAAGSPEAQPDWAVVDDEAALVAAAGAGFDVTARPAFRVRLWQAGPDEWVLVAVIHHIAGDGESMTPLLADMIVAYGARAAGHEPEFAPLAVQSADYALWQRRVLGDPSDAESVVGRQLDHWEKTLGGLPELVEIPTDRPRPPVASHRGATVERDLPAELGVRIQELAKARGVTPFMVVHAALAVLVARLSATADIAVATPTAGRGQQVLDPVIGMFVNTLVLRTEVTSDQTFDDLLAEVRGVDLEAFAQADVPFEALVERLNPVRSQSFTPLTQVMLSVDYAPTDDVDLGVEGLSVAVVPPPVVPAQLDLTFDVRIRPGQDWTLAISYATDLYDEATVATLSSRFAAVLDALIAAPGEPVSAAPLLDDGQRDLVLGWSSGAQRPTAPGTIPELVR